MDNEKIQKEKDSVLIVGSEDTCYKIIWGTLEVCSCDTYWKALIVYGSILSSIDKERD